jgi:hypothetical protein
LTFIGGSFEVSFHVTGNISLQDYLGHLFTVSSRWIRLLFLFSLMLAHGPQHHAFEHAHNERESSQDECQVDVPHIESDKSQGLHPESDCLACQGQSGKMLVASPACFYIVPHSADYLSPQVLIDPKDGSLTRQVRGPPCLIA